MQYPVGRVVRDCEPRPNPLALVSGYNRLKSYFSNLESYIFVKYRIVAKTRGRKLYVSSL